MTKTTKKSAAKSNGSGGDYVMAPRPSVSLVLNAVALAMGCAVVILAVTSNLDAQSAVVMLGIGVFCLGVGNLLRCDQC